MCLSDCCYNTLATEEQLSYKLEANAPTGTNNNPRRSFLVLVQDVWDLVHPW